MTFSGFLPQLADPPEPVGQALGVLGVALFMLRWRKSAGRPGCCAVAWALVWCLPASSLWAGGLLEHRYPYYAPAALLPTGPGHYGPGGQYRQRPANWFEPYDRTTALPRTDSAALLYAAGRAPRVIVSGAALEGNVRAKRA